jgi:hypothetical protein
VSSAGAWAGGGQPRGRRAAVCASERGSACLATAGLPPPAQDLTTLGLSTSWQHSSLAPLAALTGLEKLVVDCDAADQDEGALDGLDATALYQQLLSLTALTRLRGLWVSDNMACGGGDLMVLQHVLQASAPFVCVRPAQSDWYWRSSFPIGAQLDEPNPMLWWLWSAWNIL